MAPGCWMPQLQTVTAEMRRFGILAGGNRLDTPPLRRGQRACLPKSGLNSRTDYRRRAGGFLRGKVCHKGLWHLPVVWGTCL
jgi:hypothetical protein